MFLWHFIFALVVAFVISALFGWGFRRTGAWPGIFIFFLIIFLFSWAGGVWLVPFGPVIGGEYWLPFLVVAIFIAIFLAAAVPPEPRRPMSAAEEAEEATAAETALGVFFWFLVVLLIIAIAAFYL